MKTSFCFLKGAERDKGLQVKHAHTLFSCYTTCQLFALITLWFAAFVIQTQPSPDLHIISSKGFTFSDSQKKKTALNVNEEPDLYKKKKPKTNKSIVILLLWFF